MAKNWGRACSPVHHCPLATSSQNTRRIKRNPSDLDRAVVLAAAGRATLDKTNGETVWNEAMDQVQFEQTFLTRTK